MRHQDGGDRVDGDEDHKHKLSIDPAIEPTNYKIKVVQMLTNAKTYLKNRS